MRPKSEMLKTLSLLLLIYVLIPTQALAGPWELRKDDNGIQVYTREVDDSPFNEVRSTTILSDIRLSSMVALIQDAEACVDWADRCKESYVFEQLSDTQAYVYTLNNMPFPVKDRDHVALLEWRQDPQSLEVQMNSSPAANLIDEVRGVLRLKEVEVLWSFKPLADGTVEVSTQAHINPGSSLPGWLTNRLLVNAPHTAMQDFSRAVRLPKYREATVSFVTEPL